MAAGRPVIYAGEGEAAEIILENRIGIVCDPDSPASLAAAIEELLAAPEQRERLAMEGRAYVSRERDRDALTRRWVGLLQSLLR